MSPSARVATVLAAALVAAIVSAAPAGRPARAENGAVDHKVVLVAFDDYKDTDQYKQAERELKSAHLAVLRMHELALQKLGREGWELVWVEAKTPAQATFYLKRAR